MRFSRSAIANHPRVVATKRLTKKYGVPIAIAKAISYIGLGILIGTREPHQKRPTSPSPSAVRSASVHRVRGTLGSSPIKRNAPPTQVVYSDVRKKRGP